VLTAEAVQASDHVITMGCGDACPVFPGRKYLYWPLEDPAGKGIESVRPIRDEIKKRVEALITEIDSGQGLSSHPRRPPGGRAARTRSTSSRPP
jgi:hypothetical protein